MTEKPQQPQQAQKMDTLAPIEKKAPETAAVAVAQREKSAVEARYIMALQRPRDIEDVRQRLLKECSRPGFAETARYNKPIGKGVEGPSIRFAEAAIRCMTNVFPEVTCVFDDKDKRILRVSVTDLEANVTYASEITIEKTVERRELRRGQVPLSKRTNSYGDTVYLVEATEDDLLNKQNAQISKALRTNGLRLLPGDILEECMEAVVQTLRDKAAKDPDAEKRKILDAFSAIGVSAKDVQEYLGKPLERLQPAELVTLRGVYTTIKDGETSWDAVMEAKKKEKEPPKMGDLPNGKADMRRTTAQSQTKPIDPAVADMLGFMDDEDIVKLKADLGEPEAQDTPEKVQAYLVRGKQIVDERAARQLAEKKKKGNLI